MSVPAVRSSLSASHAMFETQGLLAVELTAEPACEHWRWDGEGLETLIHRAPRHPGVWQRFLR